MIQSEFGHHLELLRRRSGKSRYRLAQYTGLDQAYLMRLETGERSSPSRDVVIMLGLAIAENVDSVGVHDIDELLLAAEFAPLRRRGERISQ